MLGPLGTSMGAVIVRPPTGEHVRQRLESEACNQHVDDRRQRECRRVVREERSDDRTHDHDRHQKPPRASARQARGRAGERLEQVASFGDRRRARQAHEEEQDVPVTRDVHRGGARRHKPSQHHHPGTEKRSGGLREASRARDDKADRHQEDDGSLWCLGRQTGERHHLSRGREDAAV